MRILFLILSVLLLSSCSQQGFTSVFNHLKGDASASSLESECIEFPFDETSTGCNLYGWQRFAYEALKQTKSDHENALAHLGAENADAYKRLILLSQPHEAINVRLQATETMLAIAETNNNSFGHFFYMLATHNKQDLSNKKEMIYLNTKLKKQIQMNAQLKAELASTQAKIEAIMDIEKTLNTNEDIRN